MKNIYRLSIVTLAMAASTFAMAQSAPDNTKENHRDAMTQSKSADTQKNNAADLALTKRIRADVMGDKTLSAYAHNVKIVSADGNVTLNGVVHSQQEKDAIEAKAKSAAASGGVVNNIKIAP